MLLAPNIVRLAIDELISQVFNYAIRYFLAFLVVIAVDDDEDKLKSINLNKEIVVESLLPSMFLYIVCSLNST
jgi:hypothetical protein